jgi:hypothetical protein
MPHSPINKRTSGSALAASQPGSACGHVVSSRTLLVSMTAAVAPWTPKAATLGPLLRSTMSMSAAGMPAPASMNQPMR